MNKFTLSALSVAICFAISPVAVGAVMAKADYKAAKADISAKYKADQAACAGMTGNVKDICSAEATGREKIAYAELIATNEPTSRHRYDARLAQADAAYAVAIEKCDDLSGNAKDVCVKEAKAVRVKALADAKLGKEIRETKKDAAADKLDADYKVAIEKCDALAGDAKASCVAAATRQLGDAQYAHASGERGNRPTRQ